MVKVGEKYRHYKSTGGSDHTYEVVSVGFFQGKKAYEDELVVVYKALYDISALGDNIDVIVRPIDEFEESISIEGKDTKRFTLIE